MSVGCAEMRKLRKIGGFINFGETGDELNTFYFYFQHNMILTQPLILQHNLKNSSPERKRRVKKEVTVDESSS